MKAQPSTLAKHCPKPSQDQIHGQNRPSQPAEVLALKFESLARSTDLWELEGSIASMQMEFLKTHLERDKLPIIRRSPNRGKTRPGGKILYDAPKVFDVVDAVGATFVRRPITGGRPEMANDSLLTHIIHQSLRGRCPSDNDLEIQAELGARSLTTGHYFGRTDDRDCRLPARIVRLSGASNGRKAFLRIMFEAIALRKIGVWMSMADLALVLGLTPLTVCRSITWCWERGLIEKIRTRRRDSKRPSAFYANLYTPTRLLLELGREDRATGRRRLSVARFAQRLKRWNHTHEESEVCPVRAPRGCSFPLPMVLEASCREAARARSETSRIARKAVDQGLQSLTEDERAAIHVCVVHVWEQPARLCLETELGRRWLELPDKVRREVLRVLGARKEQEYQLLIDALGGDNVDATVPVLTLRRECWRLVGADSELVAALNVSAQAALGVIARRKKRKEVEAKVEKNRMKKWLKNVFSKTPDPTSLRCGDLVKKTQKEDNSRQVFPKTHNSMPAITPSHEKQSAPRGPVQPENKTTRPNQPQALKKSKNGRLETLRRFLAGEARSKGSKASMNAHQKILESLNGIEDV